MKTKLTGSPALPTARPFAPVPAKHTASGQVPTPVLIFENQAVPAAWNLHASRPIFKWKIRAVAKPE
jgi:hypothetical protein